MDGRRIFKRNFLKMADCTGETEGLFSPFRQDLDKTG